MIGVDIGGSHIKAVRLVEGAVAEQRLIKRHEDGWLDQSAELVTSLGSVGAIGVGIAGLVDHQAGRLVWAPHIAAVDVEVASELGRRLGRVVLVDNDANCAALAEGRLGAGVGFDTVLVLILGTGIGMGLVVGSELYRGRGLAGEAGHMTMVPNGSACACGKRGCWETVVSGWRLEQGLSLAEAGRWLGRGIANLIAIIDPDIVVVGGGVVEAAGEELLSPARSEIGYALEGADHRQSTPVVAGHFGMWAGAMGGALLAAARGAKDLS